MSRRGRIGHNNPHKIAINNAILLLLNSIFVKGIPPLNPALIVTQIAIKEYKIVNISII